MLIQAKAEADALEAAELAEELAEAQEAEEAARAARALKAEEAAARGEEVVEGVESGGEDALPEISTNGLNEFQHMLMVKVRILASRMR